MAIYKQRLEKNDWEDAVVLDRHLRKLMRQEQEAAAAAGSPSANAANANGKKGLSPVAKGKRRLVDDQALVDDRDTPMPSQTDSQYLDDAPSPLKAVRAANKGSRSAVNLQKPGRKPKPPDKTPSAIRLLSDDSHNTDDDDDGPRRPTKRRLHRITSSSSEMSEGAEMRSADEADHSMHSSPEVGPQTKHAQDALFKQLKRMMPVHMARKYIADLRNMKKGKAYHSDGHVSDTPESSSASSAASTDDEPPRDTFNDATTPATSSLSPADLNPGETRKRLAPGSTRPHEGGRFVLSGDSESDTDDNMSLSSSSSSNDALPVLAESLGEAPDPEAAPFDDDMVWWTVPSSRSRDVRKRPDDNIDRSLCRSENHPPRKRRPRTTAQGPRQSHASKRNRQQHQARSMESPTIRPPPKSRQKTTNAKKGQNHSRNRLPARQAPGPWLLTANPPTVQPRERRRLDFGDDDTIFNQTTALDDTARSPEQSADQALADAPRVSVVESVRSPSLGGSSHSHDSPANRLGRAVPRRSDDREHSPAARLPIEHRPNRTTDPLRTHRGSPAAVAAASSEHSAQVEANGWADVRNIRVDFDIKPIEVGTAFASSTYIGQGHLHRLINIGGESGNRFGGDPCHLRRYLEVFDLDLPRSLSLDDLDDFLPRLFDAIDMALKKATAPQPGEDPISTEQLGDAVMDAARWLHCNLDAWLATEAFDSCRRAVEATCDAARHLISRLDGENNAQGQAKCESPSFPLALRLEWMTIELLWRLLSLDHSAASAQDLTNRLDGEEALNRACSHLLLALLSAGINRPTKYLRDRLSEGNDSINVGAPAPETTSARLDDLLTELWVRLIHLLQRASERIGPHMGFWELLQGAMNKWAAKCGPRSPLMLAEATWYTIFAVCALSQFSVANGSAASKPYLTRGWNVVAKALKSVRLRYDEDIENRMPSSAVRRRDRYIRTTIKRCHELHTQWHWSLDGCDAIVYTLFEIFNSHKLTDLPSDVDHDFPAFLRRYDEALLSQDIVEEPTVYLAFINLLARTARSTRDAARDPKDAERKVSRLFSRLCPVRVMPFTKEHPPTSRERSSLFNHYTLVMLYLYLVPSAAPQRFRQMKSFLAFHTADAQSQITCIRAMLYTAAILGHHDHDVEPILSWLGSIVREMLIAADGLTRSRVEDLAGDHFATVRKTRRLVDILVHCLRSIQHMIGHPCLKSGASLAQCPYPDLRLLDRAWTSEVLESRVALEHLAVGREALQCVQAFLLRRNAVLGPPESASPVSRASVNAALESQGSMDMFDDVDFDFNDPGLENLLSAQEDGVSYQATVTAALPCKTQQAAEKDYEFAREVGTSLSASLFRLLSNVTHPDYCGGSGKTTWAAVASADRSKFTELIIDCWAGCANVLVKTGLRDWAGYLTYGNESWQRLGDCAGRIEIGMRFLRNIATLDPGAYRDHQSEFLQLWFQSAAMRHVSGQAMYTHTLFKKLDPHMRWFRRVLADLSPASFTADGFVAVRARLIPEAVEEMRAEFEDRGQAQSHLRNLVFPCLSAFLSTMRNQLDETLKAVRRMAVAAPGDSAYLAFCRAILSDIQNKAGDTLMRGISREVERTRALISELPTDVAPVSVEATSSST